MHTQGSLLDGRYRVHQAPGLRRHGLGPPLRGRAARPPGRRQAPARRQPGRRRAALQQGSEARRIPEPPEPRVGLRHRHRRRGRADRHGVRGRASRCRGCCGAGRCARRRRRRMVLDVGEALDHAHAQGDRPPRRQAGERPDPRGRRGEAGRPRHRDGVGRHAGSPAAASCWARPPTWRRSSSRAATSGRPRTSTRWRRSPSRR